MYLELMNIKHLLSNYQKKIEKLVQKINNIQNNQKAYNQMNSQRKVKLLKTSKQPYK